MVSRGQQIYSDDEQDGDSDLESLGKLSTLLEDLAKKLSTLDLNDMNFEKNADYRYVLICSKRSRNNSFCAHATSRDTNVSIKIIPYWYVSIVKGCVIYN
jgi:hypothetical protein